MLELVLGLIFIGVILWAVNTYLPIDGMIKNLINLVIVLCCILWIARSFGVFTGGPAL